jgi:hypothetical protein
MRSPACSEQSEGIFFAPRDDTGIIAFVLGFKSESRKDCLSALYLRFLNSSGFMASS